MADRLEIQYATFRNPARLDSQSSPTSAVVKGEATSIFFGRIEGEPVLVIEDASLRHPGTIPWSNVASVGWVNPPNIEWPTSSAPKPAAQKPMAKGKFVVAE